MAKTMIQTIPPDPMQPATAPRVVIIGGGFGGLSAARALDKQALEVTIVDHNNFHLFQPMLYQVATGGLSASDITTPLRSVVHKMRNLRFIMGHVTDIDSAKQLVMIDNQALPYDYLILATGASTNYFGHPEWAKMAPSMKSIDDAFKIRRMVFSAFEAAEREPDPAKQCALLTFVLVGGGPTGVELAGAIAELAHHSFTGDFHRLDPAMAHIILVQGPADILPGFPRALARRTERKLSQMGVDVRTGEHVKGVGDGYVMIEKEKFAAENIIWTAGVKASPASKWIGAEADRDGRVRVLPDLSIPGHPNIFVIGDTAHAVQAGKPLPGLAPVAIQEGKHTAVVIAERMAGKKDGSAFHYFDKGMMATVGRSYGLVCMGPIRFTGLLAWLAWVFIHIMFLITFRNRILVMLQYAWMYLTYERGSQTIIPSGAVRFMDEDYYSAGYYKE